MRIIIASAVIALFALPAAARPHKRAHARTRPAPVAKIVPNDRSAQEHARAEAELSDLRAGRVDDDKAAPAEPAQVWAIQENDREVPANLRQKK
jgi:anti-sigma-K factor RskA